jgi:hypothetical protein
MKSPRAIRYNDLMESATTRGGLPYLRSAVSAVCRICDLGGANPRWCCREYPTVCPPARNPGELSFELRGRAAERGVYVLSRRRDLPVGVTTEDLARVYAQVFDELFGGRLM